MTGFGDLWWEIMYVDGDFFGVGGIWIGIGGCDGLVEVGFVVGDDVMVWGEKHDDGSHFGGH